MKYIVGKCGEEQLNEPSLLYPIMDEEKCFIFAYAYSKANGKMIADMLSGVTYNKNELVAVEAAKEVKDSLKDAQR